MATRIAVVWNPSKTDKETLQAGLESAVGAEAASAVQWWETTPEDPGQGPAADAIAAGAELLIVAGGDGTVRAVAEHLADTSAEVEMGIVPLGTGNLFARNLDIPIDDVGGAFAAAVEGPARTIDVGWVEVGLEGGLERHGFVVMVGFGLDAHMIAETDDDLKDKAGWLAYVESLGRALSASAVVPFAITADDEPERTEEGHTFLVGNCGSLQGGVALLPEADPSDGELDYLVLSAEGVAQWLGTMKTMVWDNGIMRLVGKSEETTETESVRAGRATSLSVTLPEPRLFEIDGEEIGETRGFTVTIQPGAIRVR